MADDTAFDGWLSEGRKLAARSTRLQWEVGDWWGGGEPYGDRVNEGALLFADLYTHGSLRNLGSIAARVAPAQRVPQSRSGRIAWWLIWSPPTRTGTSSWLRLST